MQCLSLLECLRGHCPIKVKGEERQAELVLPGHSGD